MNQGFFTKEELKPNGYQPTSRSSCFTCGLYKTCQSPKMKTTGEGEKGILIWAEAPGEQEDKRGEQLVGKAGSLLRRALRENDIDLDRDCWKLNSVNCRPMDNKGNNRPPTDAEIDACRPMVWKEVMRLKPRAIFLMGGVAVDSFLGGRWPEKPGGIGKWRGWRIPDRDARAWVMPMFHPSYVLRSDNYQPVVRTVFEYDLRQAINQIDIEFPEYKNEEDCVRVLDEKGAIEELTYIYRVGRTQKKPILMAFDYECTGLKPHAPGHRIVYMSICVRESDAFVFEVTEALIPYIQKVLTCSGILKTAHNMKFEHNWSQEIFEVEVGPWLLCTMNGAHVLDNRSYITGLKFQLYVNFGTPDYASEITPYLRGEKNNANSFNRLLQAPKREAMIYCGVDSLGQFRLAQKQRRELGL